MPWDSSAKSREADVYEHLLITVDSMKIEMQSERKALILRLAALLHDSGKPLCYQYKEDTGELSFYRHEIESEKIARAVLTRLKYPNVIIEDVCHLVRNHMFNYTPLWTDAAVRRFIARVGLASIDDLFALRLADSIATTGQPTSWPLLEEFRNRIADIVKKRQAISIKDLAINGDDLAAIGVPRSKRNGSAAYRAT